MGGPTGELITGFSIRGGEARLALRARGRSLFDFGVQAPLLKPRFRLYRQIDGSLVGTSTPFPTIYPHAPANPVQLGFPSLAVDEWFDVFDLPEGYYTVVIEGDPGAGGVSVGELYELGPT